MNEYIPDILDKMLCELNNTFERFEIYTNTVSDGRLLEAYMSEIAHSIKMKCDEFTCKNLDSKINLCIRVIGDVSILACTLLTKEIAPYVITDLKAVNKGSGAGIVIYILSAEKSNEIKDRDFQHIKNVDALNTNLSTAASFVKTTDGATVEIKPVDVNKYKGVNLQDNLWRMLMQSLDET